MSGRAARAARPLVAAPPLVAPPAAGRAGAGAAGAVAAQAVCAHVLPARAMSSPGWMREEHTPQVVAYLAVIGTRTA
jgi:hypothetical protein